MVLFNFSIQGNQIELLDWLRSLPESFCLNPLLFYSLQSLYAHLMFVCLFVYNKHQNG